MLPHRFWVKHAHSLNDARDSYSTYSSGSGRAVTESQLKNNAKYSLYTGKKKVEAAFTAAMVGDAQYLRKLLTEKGGVNTVSVDERIKHNRKSLLMIAASEGQLGVVRLLLQLGAQINATCDLGRTPLMWACVKGQTACARQLLECSATLDLLDRSGHCAVTLAAEHIEEFEGCVGCFLLLKDWGALATCGTRFGETPLQMLAKHSAACHLIEHLLTEDLSGEEFTQEQRNASMVNALEWNAEKNVSVFLAAGCDPNHVTPDNVHVLHIAASQSFTCTQKLMASGSTFRLSRPYIGPSLASCNPDGYQQLLSHFQFDRAEDVLVSPVDNAILYNKFPVAKMLFRVYQMPPTYLCHDIVWCDVLITAIHNMAQKNQHWLRLVSDYEPTPQSLLRLCIEATSRMLGPVDRDTRIAQCQLPKTICREILMDNLKEENFYE